MQIFNYPLSKTKLKFSHNYSQQANEQILRLGLSKKLKKQKTKNQNCLYV